MTTNPRINHDDLEFKVMYWLVVSASVIAFFACIGGCAWLMWIVTRVVA